MMLRARLSLVAPLMVLAACATAPLTDCTSLGHGQVCLLPPAALPAVSATHMVSITRDNREDSFMGQLQIDAGALRLAGTSLFGTSLFNIEFDGQTVNSHPQQTSLEPDLLVVMLEVALADPEQLRARLHDLTLTVSQNDHTEVRELSEHGHLIAHIERSDGPLAQAHLRIDIPTAGVSVVMTPVTGSPP